jgi:hypothetical protein
MSSVQENKPDPEDVRIEYTVLSSYATTVVTFRFTLLGFYLAAAGLIIGSPLSKGKAALLLGLSFSLWLLELRNRSLLENLSYRGMQIERKYWGYRGLMSYDPFFSHMNKTKPEDDPEASESPPPDYPKVWNRKMKIPVSHTQALDLTYLLIALYALLWIFVSSFDIGQLINCLANFINIF